MKPSQNRSLHNADCNTFFYHPEQWQPEGGPYSAKAIHRYVDQVADLGFDTFVMNPNGQAPLYPSRALASSLDGYTRGDVDFFRDPAHPARSQRLASIWDLYLDLLKAGVDWLAEVAKACRARALSPWLSIRMNDMHDRDAPDSPPNGPLFRDPEYRLSGRMPQETDGLNPVLAGLNYEKQGVRDWRLALIREVVEEYDYEGLELDWLRRPICCEPNPPQETVDMMTAWFAEIRELTRAQGERIGRPYYFGMRSLPSLGQMRSIGVDVRALAREGIIDFVTASNIHQGTWDIPFDRLRDAVGPEVALYGVLNTEPNWIRGYHPESGTRALRRMHTTPEVVRGNAAAQLALGADGIETFNFFLELDTRKPEDESRHHYATFCDLTDLEALRGQPKQYALNTMRDGKAILPNEDCPEQLPAVLRPQWRRAFHIPMCAEPADEELQLIVQIVVEKPEAPPRIGVSFNGSWPTFENVPTRGLLFPYISRSGQDDVPLTQHVPEHQAFNYLFPAAGILEGWNEVTVYNGGRPGEGDDATTGDGEVCIVSIELAVTPGRGERSTGA